MQEMSDADECFVYNYRSIKEAVEEVVELKRLCRRKLRVHISTVHIRKRPFDLRDLFKTLPLPPKLQEYLTIEAKD